MANSARSCGDQNAGRESRQDIREYEITSKGVIILGKRLTHYQGADNRNSRPHGSIQAERRAFRSTSNQNAIFKEHPGKESPTITASFRGTMCGRMPGVAAAHLHLFGAERRRNAFSECGNPLGKFNESLQRISARAPDRSDYTL